MRRAVWILIKLQVLIRASNPVIYSKINTNSFTDLFHNHIETYTSFFQVLH